MKFKQIIYGLIAIFISSCTGYTKKDGKVYLRHSKILQKIGVNYLEVKNADYETFKVINNNLKIDLALDKNYVFINTSILELADPNTFEQIKGYYWKDKKNVYLLSHWEPRIIDADPKTFEVFNNDIWSKDKNHIYYKVCKVIEVESKSFVPIDEDWGKDDSFYYHQNLKLYSLDYKSAKILNSNYIKDKNSVFFCGTFAKLVKDANPKTFKADVSWLGHDDKYMFEWEENKGPITEQYKRRYIDKK